MNEEKKIKTLVFARRIVLVAVIVYIAVFFVWEFSSLSVDGIRRSFFDITQALSGEVSPGSVVFSEDENGVVHITLANISADTAYPIDCALTGKKYNTASARILTNSIGAYNDFDHPEDVKITDFDALTLENNNLHFNIPACAVMEITVS